MCLHILSLFFLHQLNETIFATIEFIHPILLPVLRDEGNHIVGIEQFQLYC